LPSGADGDYGLETIKAIKALYKDRNQPPPPEVDQRPPPHKTVSILLEALGIAPEHLPLPPPPAASKSGGSDECIRGTNLVPIYLEIDPERQIPDENRSNNRVQFTVAIDCSNVAR
jgi:hypothetical protein